MSEYQLEVELMQRDHTIKTLMKKFQKADDERIAYQKENEELKCKNVELENKVDQLKIEIDSLKQAKAYVELYSNGELKVILDDLIKWKNQMKQLKNKVIDQNKIISSLVDKLKNESVLAIDTRRRENVPIDFDDQFQSFSTLAYETVREENDKDKFYTYPCPKCKIAISSDFDFKLSQEHVLNCSPDMLTCFICLKLFNKDNQEEYQSHVGSHNMA